MNFFDHFEWIPQDELEREFPIGCEVELVYPAAQCRIPAGTRCRVVSYAFSSKESYLMVAWPVRYLDSSSGGWFPRRFKRVDAAVSNPAGDICPDCGARMEWVALRLKCPKCWRLA